MRRRGGDGAQCGRCELSVCRAGHLGEATQRAGPGLEQHESGGAV